MENLPDAILSNIFTRLLAKELAQVRGVCKSWNVLLSGPSFRKSHLQRSIRNNNDRSFMFFHESSSLKSITPDLDPRTKFFNLMSNSKLNVIGSVDGLICFDCRKSNPPRTCIWNPSLSAVLTLPPTFSHNSTNLQFGFDPKTDDYKVVKLYHLQNAPSIVEVYSMRKGSWKHLSQRFPSQFTGYRCRFASSVHGHDGHIYWLCDPDLNPKTQMIVAFDLGVETFSEIPLPNSILEDCNVKRTNVLGVLKGKLCVISGCEVWVMDEYGVWVKRHTFDQLGGDIIPLGFTSHGHYLFKVGSYGTDFYLYDPLAAKAKTFNVRSTIEGISKVVEYVGNFSVINIYDNPGGLR